MALQGLWEEVWTIGPPSATIAVFLPSDNRKVRQLPATGDWENKLQDLRIHSSLPVASLLPDRQPYHFISPSLRRRQLPYARFGFILEARILADGPVWLKLAAPNASLVSHIAVLFSESWFDLSGSPTIGHLWEFIHCIRDMWRAETRPA